MHKNLTLSIDQELLRSVRKLAVDRDTSVNQLVREFLGHLAKQRDARKATAAALADFYRRHSVTIETRGGRPPWTRDDLHERR